METKLFSQEGKEKWTIELNETLFWQKEINEGLIHRALIYQLANARKVVAHTRTRWERRWSTRKIYRQKWTGNARMGSNRSPIRKKWGVVFGPRNNVNYSISMNKKERRKALFCALTSKIQDKKLVIVEDIKFDKIATKNMVWVFKKLPYEKNALLVIPSKNEIIEKSSSNIPYIKTITANYLNIADLLKFNTLVILKDSLNKMEESYVK